MQARLLIYIDSIRLTSATSIIGNITTVRDSDTVCRELAYTNNSIRTLPLCIKHCATGRCSNSMKKIMSKHYLRIIEDTKPAQI